MMVFIPLIIVFLSLLSINLASDAQPLYQNRTYDPAKCHGQHITVKNNITLNTFCMGVKNGAINFPEGTGCLKDYMTCDFVVKGIYSPNFTSLILIGRDSRHFGFYFSKTPGTLGQTHSAVVAVNTGGEVLATFKDGSVRNAESEATYRSIGLYEDGLVTNTSVAFTHKDVISFEDNSYAINVNDALYATVFFGSSTGDDVLHLASPVKFYSGNRDGYNPDALVYNPKVCQGPHFDHQGKTLNSFCIGVKDGKINFPEGTGCLKDFQTCDYYVTGVRYGKGNYTLTLKGLSVRDFGFYFRKTPGTPGKFLAPVVTVGNEGQVVAFYENSRYEDAPGNKTYIKVTSSHPTEGMAVFKHGDVISYPKNGYEVDVHDAIYATLVTGWATENEIIHHFSSPVKFFSGQRDREPETTTAGTTTRIPTVQTETNKPTDNDGSSLGLGTTIAIIFGVLFGIAILIAIAWYFFKTSKSGSDPETPKSDEPTAAMPFEAVDGDPIRQDASVTFEADSTTADVEQNLEAPPLAAQLNEKSTNPKV